MRAVLCDWGEMENTMKRSGFFALLGLTATLLSTAGCGGGSTHSLELQPANASITTNNSTGMYSYAVLTATFTDGTVPTSVQWSTTNKCVSLLDPQRTQNNNTVVCNATCWGGPTTATITASSGALNAHSDVTCSWQP
jgi:hypothetical protein